MTTPVARRRAHVGAWAAPVTLIAAYVVSMVLLVLSAAIDFRNARDVEESSASVSRAIEASERLRTLGNTVYFAESVERGYVLTGDPAFLVPYGEMRQRLASRLEDVDRAVSESPSQRAAFAALKDRATGRFDRMENELAAYRTGGLAAMTAAVGANGGVDETVAVRTLIVSMLAEESRVLAQRREVASHAYATALTRAIVATTVVGLALTAFFALMQRYLRQRDAALAIVEASNAALEQRVHDRTADLSSLTRHLLDVREEEKKVLARDLHDDFGSYLTAINMDVSRARDKIAATHPEQAAKLERTLKLLNSAIEMKRQLISELRPSLLDNLGLGPALEQYMEQWGQRTGVQASFDYQGELQSDDDGCLIAIFRVFQEALTNVTKHAHATKVAAYAYRIDDEIEFEIADNGIGMTEADRNKPGTNGLVGIRERVLAYAGRLEITQGTQGGTVLRGAMPCHVAVVSPPAESPRLVAAA